MGDGRTAGVHLRRRDRGARISGAGGRGAAPRGWMVGELDRHPAGPRGAGWRRPPACPLHFISARQFRGARRPRSPRGGGGSGAGARTAAPPPARAGDRHGGDSSPRRAAPAAWLLRRPLLIHEQNAISRGLANRPAGPGRIRGHGELSPEPFRPGDVRGSIPPATRCDPPSSSLPPPAERFVREERGEALRVLVLGAARARRASIGPCRRRRR